MAREFFVGKNVTLSLKNVEIIRGYMNKTRRNFSKTLNIIIQQWDSISLEIMKIQEKKGIDNVLKAKVIKEDLSHESKN